MAERRVYLDRSPGELRGVVTLDGAPERLLIEREGDQTPRLGAVYAGRVTEVSRRLGLARVDLGGGQAGSLRLSAATPPPDQGQRVRVAVAAEPAGGKPVALTLDAGEAVATLGLITPAPSLEARVSALAGDGEIIGGSRARDQADEAEAAVLARRHPLPAGLVLSVEPTAALVAVDVDLEPAAALSVGQANLRAIAEAARLLRLKGLAGLAVIDLIGFPKDRRRLLQAAAEAFAPDGPQAVIGALGRFGTLEVAKPHREQPLTERLFGDDATLSARTIAQALVRDLERQGAYAPGARLTAVCAPEVADLLRPLVQRLGPRFAVREALGVARGRTDIVTS